MLLNNDYIDPVELTGYVREALADMEQNRFTLSRHLPTRPVDDLEFRFTRGGQGLTEAATLRAYDAESPIGARPGTQRVSGELPPISRKIRLGEYDRLRQRRLDGQIRDQIFNDAETMTRAVAARVELMRGEALYKGKLEINENGVIATVDFGRSASHTVTAATPWTTTASSTPIANLRAWSDVFRATNGVRPGVIKMAEADFTLMMLSQEVRDLVYPGANQPSIVTQDGVRAITSAFGLPPIELYEAQVKVDGVATEVIPLGKVLMLPAVGDSELGATLWGTTAESLEAGYGLSGDEPGIVAGAYSTDDPVAVWTKAAGIALPVLANPDLSFAATVR